MFTVGVFAIIFDEQKRVLLGHRTDIDLWNLPGGALESDESPQEVVIREVKEEFGVDVAVDRFIGIYSKPGRAEIVFSFVCRIIGGQPTPCDETDQVNYFSFAHIPRNFYPHALERIQDALDDKEGVCRAQLGPSVQELLANGTLAGINEDIIFQYQQKFPPLVGEG